MASPLQSGGTSGAEDLLRPCLPLRLVASFQLPPTPFKKNFFLLLVVFHVSLYSSPFSICALRFSLSLRLPFFRTCAKIFCLFASFFSPFFAVLTALHTSCPMSALSLASLCFSFVLKCFCKR